MTYLTPSERSIKEAKISWDEFNDGLCDLHGRVMCECKVKDIWYREDTINPDHYILDLPLFGGWGLDLHWGGVMTRVGIETSRSPMRPVIWIPSSMDGARVIGMWEPGDTRFNLIQMVIPFLVADAFEVECFQCGRYENFSGDFDPRNARHRLDAAVFAASISEHAGICNLCTKASDYVESLETEWRQS